MFTFNKVKNKIPKVLFPQKGKSDVIAKQKMSIIHIAYFKENGYC